MERAATVSLISGQALWGAWLAATHLAAGRVHDAAQIAERSRALAHQYNERAYEAWALRVLAEIAAHARDASTIARPSPQTDQAEDYYRQALALAEELGMRPLQAHCHLGLGALYQRAGRRDQAQAELTTASHMYRAMEMTFWLQRAENELAQVGH